jgi:hypothetical protein
MLLFLHQLLKRNNARQKEQYNKRRESGISGTNSHRPDRDPGTGISR